MAFRCLTSCSPFRGCFFCLFVPLSLLGAFVFVLVFLSLVVFRFLFACFLLLLVVLFFAASVLWLPFLLVGFVCLRLFLFPLC